MQVAVIGQGRYLSSIKRAENHVAVSQPVLSQYRIHLCGSRSAVNGTDFDIEPFMAQAVNSHEHALIELNHLCPTVRVFLQRKDNAHTHLAQSPGQGSQGRGKDEKDKQ